MEECNHPYATKKCPMCGHIFCYSCCRATNVDQGGKHEPDFMSCPKCGHNYYEKDNTESE